MPVAPAPSAPKMTLKSKKEEPGCSSFNGTFDTRVLFEKASVEAATLNATLRIFTGRLQDEDVATIHWLLVKDIIDSNKITAADLRETLETRDLFTSGNRQVLQVRFLLHEINLDRTGTDPALSPR